MSAMSDLVNMLDPLRRDPGTARECVAQKRHRPHHHMHPQGGRIVCHICHPPAEVLIQRAKERANAAS